MYQAMEALAHGASNVTWFTYWTPNPSTVPGGWQGGAITYTGERTDRLPLVAAVNADLRAVATERGPGPMLALHLGADLPTGIAPGSPAMIPHVRGSEGRALSVGFGAEDARGERRYVLVNRDRSNPDACSLQFDGSVDSARVLARSSPPGSAVFAAVHGPGPAVQVTLEPGGGAVIATWRSPGGTSPRTPSRSDTR